MKSKILIIFLSIILLFSGCTSDSYKAEVPPSLLCTKELQAKIISPSFSGTAAYSILDTGAQKIQIISPEEANGLTVIYKNGKVTLSLDTIEVEDSEACLPESFFASVLFSAIEKITQCSITPQKEGELWTFRTSESENPDILRVSCEGVLYSFESPKNNLRIEFTDTNPTQTE